MAAEKPVLIYVKGRGRGQIIRLTMAAAGIEFDHGDFVDKPEKLNKLRADGTLQFDQLPLVKYKGMNMVQCFSTARYFADIGGMMGNGCKEEKFRINMLADGANDFYGPFMSLAMVPDDVFTKTTDDAMKRYMPKFEKVLSEGQNGFLVGGKLSFADVALFHVTFAIDENKGANALDPYPNCKAHLEKIRAMPSMKKFLESDKHFPKNTPDYYKMLKYVFQF